MSNSLFKQLGSVVSTTINTEATARQTAVSQLQSNINTEVSARQTADTTLTNAVTILQTNLASEANARQTADNSLTSSVSTLQTELASEVSARQTADTTLTNAINAEVSARQTAITTLQGSVDTLNGDNTVTGSVAKTIEAAISGGSGGTTLTSVGFTYTDYSLSKFIQDVGALITINLSVYFPEITWGSTNTQTYGWLIQRKDGVANGVAQFGLVQGGYRPTANGGCKATVLPFQVNADNTITVGTAATLWTNSLSPNDFSTCSVVTDNKSGSFHYSGNIPWPGSSTNIMNYGTAIINANNTASNIYYGSGADNTVGIHDHNGQYFGLPDSDGSGWLGVNTGFRQSDSKTMIHGLDFRSPSSPSISVQNPGSDASTSPMMQFILQANSTTANTAISGCTHWRQSGPRVWARVFAGNSTNYNDISQISGDWGLSYRSGQFWGVALSTGKVLVYHGNITNLFTAYNSYSDVTSSAGVLPGFSITASPDFGGACIVPDGVDSWLVLNATASVIEKWSINPTTYKWTRKWGTNIVYAGGSAFMKLNILPNNRLLISKRDSSYAMFQAYIITRASLPA